MPIDVGDSSLIVRSKINQVLTNAGLDPAGNVDTTTATTLLNEAAGLWDVDVEFVDRMPEAEFRADFAILEEAGVYAGIAGLQSGWSAEQAAVRVPYGGQPGAGFLDSANLGGASGAGRTFMGGTVAQGIRQDGYVRAIRYKCRSSGTNGVKFLHFRPSGTSGDGTVISETEKFTPVLGDNTFVPASPLGPFIPGDRIGIWMSSAVTLWATADAGGACYYGAGELTSLSTPTLVSGFNLNIEYLGVPPLLIGTGDSIMEGHNSVSPWHTQYHLGPSGNLQASILQQMRNLVPTLETQNFGQSGGRWDNTLTKISAIDNQKSWGVIVHSGVNDVSADRSWASIEADMNAFKAGLTHGQRLFINQVLPWTAGNDAQASSIRALNANYAAWCAANDATLIPCHDPLGQLRTSTGELDDLRVSYNYDGVHLTVPDGVAAMAEIMSMELGKSI